VCLLLLFLQFEEHQKKQRNHEKETNNETAESTPVIVGLQERIEEPGGIPTLTGMETAKKPESTGSGLR